MEEDEQPYDPTEGDVSTPAAAAAGGLVGGSTDATAAGFPDIPDMLPVVCERPLGGPPGPSPGQLVWHGCFVVSHGSFFSGHVQHLGGMGEPGRMLGAPGGNVSVMGRVALDKFAEFARELRSSRSRTISLGLVTVAPGAPGPEVGYCRELREGYSSKGRIGKLGLAKEVEGYLVAPSGECSGLWRWGWKGVLVGKGCVCCVESNIGHLAYAGTYACTRRGGGDEVDADGHPSACLRDASVWNCILFAVRLHGTPVCS
jgi:hypothetical protein